MSRLIVLALLLVATAAPAQPPLLIRGATVVSCHLDAPLADHDVLVVDGRISAVGPDLADPPPGTVVLDGGGRYLTPGLMDSHVHVSLVPGLGFTGTPEADAHPDVVEAYLEQQPRSYLYHGVTQVLDPNPGLSWRRFEAAPLAPDLYRCEVVTAPGTYPWVEQPDSVAARLFPYMVDADDPRRSPEAVVERIAGSGAVGMKLYFEDGFGDGSEWPLLDDETIGRLRSAAHARGLVVVAHANAWDMYAAALRNRVDVMMHGLWNWGPENGAAGVPAPVAGLLDRILADGTGFMPTTQVTASLGGLMGPDVMDDPALVPLVPPRVLAWYGTPEARWFQEDLVADFGGLEPEVIAGIFERIADRGLRVLGHLHEGGHPLLLGSDCPGSPAYVNQPGLTTYREMVALAEAGVPPADILAAATINNVRRFGLEEDFGTVEPGKVANLLLLEDDPLISVNAWDSIVTVVLRGLALPRASLAAR